MFYLNILNDLFPTIVFFSFLCALPLFAILIYIAKEGITKINWAFFVNTPAPVCEAGGGIANALVGSLIIVAVAAIIAIPLGILGGIYLSENKTGKLSYWSRLAVDVLQGVPSIVIGIVVYFWLVKSTGTFSAARILNSHPYTKRSSAMPAK